MGLDEFMDIESTSSDSTKENDNETSITDKDGITKYDDGDIGSRGPIGYQDFDEYRSTIDGEVEIHGSLFKYKMPIFPHIENKEKYSQESRYKLKNEMQDVSCVSSGKTSLGNLSRELIMLDTGETDKQMCLDVLEKRFGNRPKPSTTVVVYFFSKVRHVAKMAIADEKTDNWTSPNKDEVIKAIYDETYTQRFSKTDGNDYEHKHWNHIEEW